MKNLLNRELIEGLNESSNQEFLKKVNDIVFGLVSSAIEDISEKSPFIRGDKCVLVPANEVYLGAFSQLSEYDYFLGIENAQIQMNSKLKKNYLKYIWREFKAAWRLGKKKYKKRKKDAIPVAEVDKYKISDFRHDLVMKIAERVSESSLIYEFSKHISLIGSEDFGTNVKINIYVCCYEAQSQTFKMFVERKNKFFDIKFGKRFEHLDFKLKTCGNMFVDMVKIFNALYSKRYSRVPNQILIESLLFACPALLFDKKDVYKTFINVANYIRLLDPKSFASICDPSKSIFDEPLIVKSNQQIEFGKIIAMLDDFKY